MRGIDTNVLVRLLVNDDAAQFEASTAFVRTEADRGEPVLLSLLVLLEAEWVLRSRYGRGKDAIADAFSALLATTDLRFEDEASVEIALRRWRSGPADFADCLIAARNEALGCDATVTFDQRAAACDGFERLEA